MIINCAAAIRRCVNQHGSYFFIAVYEYDVDVEVKYEDGSLLEPEEVRRLAVFLSH